MLSAFTAASAHVTRLIRGTRKGRARSYLNARSRNYRAFTSLDLAAMANTSAVKNDLPTSSDCQNVNQVEVEYFTFCEIVSLLIAYKLISFSGKCDVISRGGARLLKLYVRSSTNFIIISRALHPTVEYSR